MASLAIAHPDFLEGWISFRSHFLQGEPCSNPGQNRPENMLASETGGPCQDSLQKCCQRPRLHYATGQTARRHTPPRVCARHMWTLDRDSKTLNRAQWEDKDQQVGGMGPASQSGQGCLPGIWKNG